MNRLLKRSLFLVLGSFLAVSVLAQKEEVPQGWHLMDKQDSGYYGISMAKAYALVKSKNLKSSPVIVAIIDSGVDTTHEDLRSILWHNPKEIPGNGIDDDKNGYVDDVYGWNFLGSQDGKANVEKDSYEAARVYHALKAKWDGKTIDVAKLSKDDAFEYAMWQRSKKEVADNVNPLQAMQMKKMFTDLKAGDSVIRKDLNKEEYNCKDLANYTSTNSQAQKVAKIFISICKGNDNDEISNQQVLDELEGEVGKADAATTAPPDFRGSIVKDNYSDFNDKFYGNSNVMVSNNASLHGTHVSGIIGAAHNGIGMDGVADNVQVMMVRAVPDGDEHDKDIALAIRYAVDNGAKVINMSFGKSYSPQKKWVDDAVRYAQAKGVLMVHAAGNEAANIDSAYNFPTPVFLDGTTATNWITVGASGDPKAGGLTASFSNYGKKQVDVFAPGVKIYSTVPGGNTYQNLQGTSMASPVVAGLAGFLLEYYPNLSAQQVKYVIEKSATNPNVKVNKPGTDENVNLQDISKSGGIINAYAAIKLAGTLKGERNKTVKPVKTQSTIKPKAKS